MAITMSRIRAHWSGFTGSPGLTTIYADDPSVAVPALGAFFNSIKSVLPAAVTVQVDGSGDEINDGDGVIIGSFSFTPPASVVGTGGTNYSAPVGACVDWLTATVIGRRRVMGRMFVVPMATTMYDVDGTLTSTCMTTLNGALATFRAAVGASGQYVWHRPKAPSSGLAVVCTGQRVPDKACVLRSRRD